jgi:probable rRNA maturation factor
MSEPTARTRRRLASSRGGEEASAKAPRLTVTNRQRRVSLDAVRLGELSRELTRVAAEEHLDRSAVSVVLVCDSLMRRLNRDFHGRAEVTDVLAFDYGRAGPHSGRPQSGHPVGSCQQEDVEAEVVVSAERALAEAHSRGLPPQGELLLYCIHGLLHLAGYEDGTPTARQRMWRRQLRHLARAGFPARPGRRGLSWRAATHFRAPRPASPISRRGAKTRSAATDGPRASGNSSRTESKR